MRYPTLKERAPPVTPPRPKKKLSAPGPDTRASDPQPLEPDSCPGRRLPRAGPLGIPSPAVEAHGQHRASDSVRVSNFLQVEL